MFDSRGTMVRRIGDNVSAIIGSIGLVDPDPRHSPYFVWLRSRATSTACNKSESGNGFLRK